MNRTGRLPVTDAAAALRQKGHVAMNADQITRAAEAVGWLAEQAQRRGEDADLAQMAVALELSRSYLLEYAKHLTKGADPDDAVMTTARGDSMAPRLKKPH